MRRTTGGISVIWGDARSLPLPDTSVDLIVTSPPYFGLRSYTDAGEHYAAQIGSETTPGEWLAAMVDCTAEWVRVLKPSGSLFVNLGDSYAAYNNNRGPSRSFSAAADPGRGRVTQPGLPPGARAKSLFGLPWRYALACMDDLGLILRRDLVWHKRNGLPESAADRCRSSHEYVFHLVKQPRYYSAIDEIREPQATTGERHGGNTSGYARAPVDIARSFSERTLNPLGKLPGSVWDIPSQPLVTPAYMTVGPLGWVMTDADAWRWAQRTGTVSSAWPRDDSRRELRAAPAHFAAFPMELPRRIIAGWSPPGVCVACGEGRRPVVDRALTVNHVQRNAYLPGGVTGHPRWDVPVGANRVVGSTATTVTGYACGCPTPDAPTRPAVVLDPFGGTGTTALVAAALGRHGITVDRSQDYCRLATWRTRDPGEVAKAVQVRKPPVVPVDQDALFNLDGP